MKRSPLRAKSKKRTADDRTRRNLVEDYLEEHWACGAKLPLCGVKATDVHELVNRSQLPGAQLIPELFLGLCRRCHSHITTHPRWAHAHGFLLHAWDYEQHGIAALIAAQEARNTCRDISCPYDHWRLDV